jgi:hypothetical protein
VGQPTFLREGPVDEPQSRACQPSQVRQGHPAGMGPLPVHHAEPRGREDQVLLAQIVMSEHSGHVLDPPDQILGDAER